MNFSDMFPLQVVINLDKRPDRLEICREKEFPKLGINPIRKPGRVLNVTDNSWWNGAIGCLVSHYEALEAGACLDTNVFVFEDDVSFLGLNTSEVLDKACEELNEIEWDMFYIGGNILKPFYQETKYLAKLTHCQSTVSYGVNKNFVKTLLKAIDLNHIDAPIDVIYADRIIPNNRCYITIPMLAIQRDSFSDIEGKEVEYTKYLSKRYWDNFVKTIGESVLVYDQK